MRVVEVLLDELAGLPGRRGLNAIQGQVNQCAEGKELVMEDIIVMLASGAGCQRQQQDKEQAGRVLLQFDKDGHYCHGSTRKNTEE